MSHITLRMKTLRGFGNARHLAYTPSRHIDPPEDSLYDLE